MKWISCDNSLDYLVSPRPASSIYLFVAGDDNLSVSDSPLSPLTPLSPSLLRSTPSPKVRPLVQFPVSKLSLSLSLTPEVLDLLVTGGEGSGGLIVWHLLPALSLDCVATVTVSVRE